MEKYISSISDCAEQCAIPVTPQVICMKHESHANSIKKGYGEEKEEDENSRMYCLKSLEQSHLKWLSVGQAKEATHRHRQTLRQTQTQTDTDTDTDIDRHRHRQTRTQTQTLRQTGRQTDTETDRH